MKKNISKSLVITNIIVVAILLISSAIIFIANTQNGLFNYQAKLIIGKKLDDKISDKCLVIVKLNDTALKKGSYIIYSIDDKAYIAKVDSVDEKIISYKNNSDEVLTLDITSKEYNGAVIYKSNFLGTVLYSLTKKENVSLTFIIIAGIFFISLLSLAIIYTLHNKKIQIVDITADEDEQVADNTDEMQQKQDEKENKSELNYIFKEENNESQPSDNSEVETPSQTSIEKNQTEKIQNIEIAFTKHQEPEYVLKNDDVPSIDSLMESIEAQFKDFIDEDKSHIKK